MGQLLSRCIPQTLHFLCTWHSCVSIILVCQSIIDLSRRIEGLVFFITSTTQMWRLSWWSAGMPRSVLSLCHSYWSSIRIWILLFPMLINIVFLVNFSQSSIFMKSSSSMQSSIYLTNELCLIKNQLQLWCAWTNVCCTQSAWSQRADSITKTPISTASVGFIAVLMLIMSLLNELFSIPSNENVNSKDET
jgi:hypothetical protein